MFAGSVSPTLADPTAAVRGTDTSAAHARLSASRLSYFADPFAALFLTSPSRLPSCPPLINIGTFLRRKALDELVEGFFEGAGEGGKVQVLSVGAGSDTRFWNLATGPLKDKIAAYVELDFAEVTSSKARTICKHAKLRSVVDPLSLSGGGTTLDSLIYHLHPIDLRQPPSLTLSPLLLPNGGPLSPTLPTLLLAECVLVYLQLTQSEAIFEWASNNFSNAPLGAVVYEMFGLEDSFGRVMRDNLRARDVELPGALPSLSAFSSRLLSASFNSTHALTLLSIRQQYVSPSETKRIAQLERIDEYEELDLVLAHYAISWGVKVPQDEHERRKDAWLKWGLRIGGEV